MTKSGRCGPTSTSVATNWPNRTSCRGIPSIATIPTSIARPPSAKSPLCNLGQEATAYKLFISLHMKGQQGGKSVLSILLPFYVSSPGVFHVSAKRPATFLTPILPYSGFGRSASSKATRPRCFCPSIKIRNAWGKRT